MKHMKHLVSMGALVMSLMIVMAASAFAAMDTSGADYEMGTITASGTGFAADRARNATHARMLARRAAIVDCYRNLLEMTKGVQVESDSRIEDLMSASDIASAKVQGVVKGARIVSEKDLGEGGYEVVMAIDMFGAKSLAGAVMSDPGPRESFPNPVPTVAPSMPAYDTNASVSVRIDVTANVGSPQPAPNNNAIGGYTGLIVDCRGLGLSPAMSPVIKNQSGDKIYGHKNLDSDYVVSKGMAAYTQSPTANIARAGNNPLVVRAVSVDNRFNPVVSVADANRILIENNSSHFLEQTNVVFIR